MLTILISDLMFVSPVAVLRIWIAEVISRQISRLWIVWNYNLYVLILPIFTTIGYLGELSQFSRHTFYRLFE